MVAVGLINYGITLSCLAGLGLSIYAYVVELQAQQNSQYEALCDISEHMSCSKVFTSEYGRGFGLAAKYLGEDSVFNKPNSLAGILVYSLLATLAQSSSGIITKFSLLVVIITNLFSIYWAYILYFVLKSLCVVCVSTYVVNLVNLLLVYCKLKTLKSAATSQGSKKKKMKKN